MTFGMCIARSHYAEDGTVTAIEIMQADDVIEVSAELAEARGIGREGGLLTLSDDVTYNLTDWTPISTDSRTGNTFIGTRVRV